MKRVQTEVTEISFRIDVEWPECDVDVVYSEIGGMYQDIHEVGSRTPTSESVDRFLDAVAQDQEIQRASVDFSSSCPLMMGCCHVVFSTGSENLDRLADLISFAKKRVKELRRKHVRYHKPKEIVGHSCRVIGARR